MMLSISNIGWGAEDDKAVYSLMDKYGVVGLEIAPTRIISDMPYDRMETAKEWAEHLSLDYGFKISSMQSIWYGRQERLFGPEDERRVLMEYTKKAIDFAWVIGCGNLVFGCPRNRTIQEGWNKEQIEKIAIPFFRELGDYAETKHTVLAIEANPPIYNTNYINDTAAALQLIEKVDSPGFMLNLDIGTMIENQESVIELKGKVHLINHVHISEPGLGLIYKGRKIHKELVSLLNEERYGKFLSIEMKKQDNMQDIEAVIQYVRDLDS